MDKFILKAYEKYKSKLKSLDEIIAKVYDDFKKEYSNSQDKVVLENIANRDIFKTTLLNVVGISEYDYYTKNVDKKLKDYVESSIYPEYQKNDKAHGIVHIREVVRRAFALNETLGLGLNDNMIFAMASCHDLGKHIEHTIHEKIAASKFMEDEGMKKFFSDTERVIIRDAIEDHRSSKEDNPRSTYGKLISSADRNTSIEMVFIRSFFVGQERTPDMTIDEFLDFTFKRLSKRYGEENPENMFYSDETYERFLAEMRALLKDEVAFKDRYCKVNGITNRSNLVINENGFSMWGISWYIL